MASPSCDPPILPSADPSIYLRTSLDDLLKKAQHLITWRKQCVELLQSAFTRTDRNYLIFACRITARFLFCRGAILPALRLLERVMEIVPLEDHYNAGLIRQDYQRFQKEIGK